MVGVVTIGMILTMSIRSKIAARNAQRPDPRELPRQTAHARHATGDAEAVMSRLLDLSQRLAAQLDNKAERLEQLLEEADERIARLEQHGAAGGPVAARKSGPAAPVATADPLTSSVYRLADEGRNCVEIARQLNEQVGKVELILALREAG